jgi:hypothetical protein
MSTIDNRLTNLNIAATLPAASAQKASAQQQNVAGRQAGGTSGATDITLNAVSGTGQTAAATGEDGLTPAYTVEISEKGAAISAAATVSADGGSAAPGSAQATDQNTTTAASSGTANTAASTSETNINNLSIYNDYQLQKLLNNGEISRNEYNGEIVKREGNQVKESTGSVAAMTG